MRIRKAVPAGVIDAGFAALATFVISIYAARVLATDILGYYSVFFTAFLAAIQVPAKLLMVPTEIHAMTLPPEQRMSLLTRSLPRGWSVSVLAAIGGAAIGLAITVAGGLENPLPFAATLMVAAMVSPLQDHIRRMLHAALRSWAAAVVSVTQAIGVVVSLGILILLGVDPVWIPFSALAFANVLSSTTGLLMSRRGTARLTSPLPSIRTQMRTGLWLLGTGLLAPVGGLVVQGIVLALAGATILGFAEAARVVGRPILVVSTGLGQALAPRSISAAQSDDRASGRRIASVFWAVFVLGGVLYTALVSFDWALNVADTVVPKAYEIGGLVLAVCLSNIVVGVGFPQRYELLGGGREPWVTLTEAIGQAGRSMSALAAAPLGAFVIPLGDVVLGLVRVVGYRMKMPDVYSATPSGAHTSPTEIGNE